METAAFHPAVAAVDERLHKDCGGGCCRRLFFPPPFTVDVLWRGADGPEAAPRPPLASLLPASFRSGHNQLEDTSLTLRYLSAELGLSRLEDFNHWFWLLSSPCLPRPLHDAAFLEREITITESMDRHMGVGVRGDGARGGGGTGGGHNHLYLKPVPRVLLDPRFWTEFLPCPPGGCGVGEGCGCAVDGSGAGPSQGLSLSQGLSQSLSRTRSPEQAVGGGSGGTTGSGTKCARRQLFECALGFLFSYAALVSHESDFWLAREKQLLPAEVGWDGWRALAAQVVAYPGLQGRVHRRFLYGELHLHLLEEMRHLRRGGLLRVLVGRLELLTRFFQTNVRWLASLAAYIALVLTALQAGLATQGLMDNPAFQTFSYGFTVFSLVAPFAVVVAFAFYFGAYLLYCLALNLVDARHGETMRRRRLQKTHYKNSRRTGDELV